MSRLPARNIFLIPVKLYKKFISPLLGDNCIYTPTCSDYFISSVTKHGIAKGTILGIARILRCNRHFIGGYDCVPDEFSLKTITTPYTVFKRSIKMQKKL